MGAFDFSFLEHAQELRIFFVFKRERTDPYNTITIIPVKRGLRKENKKRSPHKDQPRPNNWNNQVNP